MVTNGYGNGQGEGVNWAYGNFVKIINPLGEDLAVMRTSLLPSIVKAVAYNLNRKNFDGRLFELAKVYFPKQVPMTELPVEKTVLSIATFGENEDYFTIKGVVEGILSNFIKESYVPIIFL